MSKDDRVLDVFWYRVGIPWFTKKSKRDQPIFVVENNLCFNCFWTPCCSGGHRSGEGICDKNGTVWKDDGGGFVFKHTRLVSVVVPIKFYFNNLISFQCKPPLKVM